MQTFFLIILLLLWSGTFCILRDETLPVDLNKF